MKPIGLIGGIGPESTIIYYRAILARVRNAPILINSIDVTRVLDLAGRGAREEMAEWMLRELDVLARAGARVGAFASNTPHLVFDAVQRRAPLPLVSIVDAAAGAVADAGMRRVALFGTKFTMSGGFYADVFSRRGIEVIVPDEREQDFIHGKYVGELLNNIFSDETRAAILAIATSLRERAHVEGVILGGTELPLLITQHEHDGLRLLDTMQIHVERIVAAASEP
ncbi:MAG TPA: amino acid racemase [Thermoanaerobaculia bacterium]|nr:amino acid racemase [Thermoanaerobaculia bacterium]